jgi:hypothetical protein
MLDTKLKSMDKQESGRYEVPGICLCPVHGQKEYEAFYVRNTRDVDLSGYSENGRIMGYVMH